MRELNKNKVYDLSELTSEERKEVEKVAKIHIYNYKYLLFSSGWFVCSDGSKFCTETTNAKELFYTLENVQVDCRELSEEQIKEMVDVFEANGFYIGSLNLIDKYYFLRDNFGKYCLVAPKDYKKTTITYNKFMELFGNKEEKPSNVKIDLKTPSVLTNEQINIVLDSLRNKPNYSCDSSNVYSDIKNLIEKGKQHGLKIVVTFEKL